MKQNMTVTFTATRPFLRFIGIIFATLLASTITNTAVAGPMFSAHLDGAQEVLPVISAASGTAHFEFNDALTEMTFSLYVFNIINVTMAHIHLAPFDGNGPVILWLYPSTSPALLIPGLYNGLLASGTVTEANFVSQYSGQPLSYLYDAMVAGNAYVNVHTTAFPGGEIRGQIQPVSEPATLTILGLGLAAFGVAYRRRWRPAQ